MELPAATKKVAEDFKKVGVNYIEALGFAIALVDLGLSPEQCCQFIGDKNIPPKQAFVTGVIVGMMQAIKQMKQEEEEGSRDGRHSGQGTPDA